MEKFTTSNKKVIQIPKTAGDWELYQKDGRSNLAAANLTKRLLTCFKLIEKYVGKGDGVVEAAAKAGKRMRETMEKYAHVGATDTEPRVTAGFAFRDFVAARYDVSLMGSTAEKVYDSVRY